MAIYFFLIIITERSMKLMITASDSHAVGNSDDNASPICNFRCVREIENEKRERVERMGVIPAFDEGMDNMAATYNVWSNGS